MPSSFTSIGSPSAITPPPLTGGVFTLNFPLTQDFSHNHFGIPQGVHGRGGYPLVAIVVHELGMSMESYISYLHSDRRPEDIRPQEHGSVHYGVEVGGALHQFVRDSDTAWGLEGLSNPTWALTGTYSGVTPDYLFIHIGLESFLVDAPTSMFRALAELVAYIARNNNLTVDAVHVIGHDQLDSRYPQCGEALLTNLIAVAAFYVANGNAPLPYDLASIEAQFLVLQGQVTTLTTNYAAAMATIATFAAHPTTIAGATVLGHVKSSPTVLVNATTGVASIPTLAAVYTVGATQTIVPNIPSVVQFGTLVYDQVTPWAILGAFQRVKVSVAGLYCLRARVRFSAADWSVGSQMQLDVYKNGVLYLPLALETLQATLTGEVVELEGACEFVVTLSTDAYDVRALTDDATVTSPTKTIANGQFVIERIGA